MASPDRTYEAVRYSRRCGNGQPYLNVSVVAAGEAVPDHDGNALVEQPPTDRGGYSYSMTISWEGRELLRIVRDGITLKKADVVVGRVAIEHRLERQLNP